MGGWVARTGLISILFALLGLLIMKVSGRELVLATRKEMGERGKDWVRLVHELQHDDELGARQKDNTVRCTEDASLLWDRCAVKKELYELFDFAWPLVSTFTLNYVANIVSMAFVGQLGAVDLAAAGSCLAAASPSRGALGED